MNQNGGVINMGQIKIELTIDGEKVLGRKTQGDDVTVGELSSAAIQLELIRDEIKKDIADKRKSMGVRVEKEDSDGRD